VPADRFIKLFFAESLGAGAASVREGRRRLGPKAGCCPWCGYSLAGLEGVFLILLCLVFLLLGSERAFRAGYLALACATALLLAAFLVKWYRELSAPART
jgi:hypothetical protein